MPLTISNRILSSSATYLSSAAVQPVQLQFEFMHGAPLQLSPARQREEFAALRRSTGSDRDRRTMPTSTAKGSSNAQA